MWKFPGRGTSPVRYLALPVLFSCLVMVAILCHSSLNAQPVSEGYELSEEVTIERIAPGAYLVTHRFPWAANSLLVRCDDTTFVWIDTPYTDEATRQVLAWVRARFGPVGLTEINTGFHNDNLGGNGCLEEHGIPVYGSHLTARLVRERSEQTRQELLAMLNQPELKKYYDVHAAAVYHEPNRLFPMQEGLTLHLGGEDIDVWYPGPSHAPDNLVVYFPEKQLLFGGCMVKDLKAQNLGFTADADMAGWPLALQRLLRKYRDAQIIVPGHGAVGGLELIHHTLSLF